MIVKALLDIIYALLNTLLVFRLPDLPESVISIANSATQYFVTGVGMLRCFIGNTAMLLLAVMFELVIAMNAAYMLYSFVMWVIKKIPMLGVE